MVKVCAREKNVGWGCGLKPVTHCVCLPVKKKKSLCVIKDCHSVRTCMVQKGLLHFSSSALLFFSFQKEKQKSVCLCVLKLWFMYIGQL